ncbi:hypothetical protein LHYA1_G009147 [Lachnellula hyalina]|uniref:Uncharacterized protein n=1 Tax=Lachnellula hyalina TaxID=1316788 RepID=A0A8H8QSZ6_9HELO|nr:uncharacterized protein LHYA1_G009147 [Lachnellula hyalina]TVY22098.1 hypothetical protein LHYA1_G009147 [Lachnellula hyalina]
MSAILAPAIYTFRLLRRLKRITGTKDSKSIFKALAYTKLRWLELVPNLKLSATHFATIFTTKCDLFR